MNKNDRKAWEEKLRALYEAARRDLTQALDSLNSDFVDGPVAAACARDAALNIDSAEAIWAVLCRSPDEWDPT